MSLPSDHPPAIRLDRWLWFARKVKTRSKATKLIKEGKIRVNQDKISKPAHMVQAGDVITARFSPQVLVLKIIETGTRRGPASEAQMLYEDLSPPPAAPKAPRPARPEREKGAGRPTKRERRQTDRLRWNTLYDAGD